MLELEILVLDPCMVECCCRKTAKDGFMVLGQYDFGDDDDGDGT